MMYRAGDESWYVDVFERLREVRTRVIYNCDVMCEGAISKGW